MNYLHSSAWKDGARKFKATTIERTIERARGRKTLYEA